MSEKSFKQLEAELDVLLARIEQADYEELDGLLKDYETGMNVIKSLEKKLKEAKNSLKKVSQ